MHARPGQRLCPLGPQENKPQSPDNLSKITHPGLPMRTPGQLFGCKENYSGQREQDVHVHSHVHGLIAYNLQTGQAGPLINTL